MNKNYNLKLDLQFRCNNSIMKFNQFDNNTSDFFMRITNGGNLVDIEKALVVLAVIKPSGKVSSQFVEVENGLVYADLKANMKDEIGNYTAQAMLILEDERVVTDVISYKVEEDKIFSLLNDTVEATEEFTLLTDMLSRLSTIEISEEQRVINEAERILSEENRKIEEAKRVEAELIRQHEEADRVKYDVTRESNENIRKQNESIRLVNETNRIDEETKRVEEENKRKLAEEERNANYNFMTEDEERRRLEANAHKEAEKLRAQAENTRVNEEAKRRTTEQARVSAENTRVSNENTRKANETTRQTNETHRVEAETQRQNRYNSFILDAEINANNFENYTNSAKIKEEERKSNELNRKSQEDRRVSNEVERISNENTRKANEVAREKNETSRQYVFENKVNEVDKKIVELNTTKDNFVSSVNTKVDTKISELDNAKSDMTTTVSNKVNEVENRFNALTSKQQQDAEVIDARDGETSLKARLDRDIEKAKEIYVPVEGSHISTDSSVGYAKDVEILGNTIQNASNLADIRSVGDKVEGQELYEIPVLSCGKNLFDMDNISSNIISKSDDTYEIHTQTPVNLYNKSIFKAVKNVQYTVSYKAKLGTATNFRADFVYTDGSFQQFSYCNSTTEFIQITKTSDKNKQLDYVRFNWTNAGTVYIKDIQIEEGTQATPYEPYQEDKLTILSPVQLEKVGNVADRIIEKDGVWGVEKNVGNYIFKGNEVNASQGVVGDIHLWYWSDADKVLQNKNNTITVMHTKLPHKKAGTSNAGYEAISFNGNGKNLLIDTKQSTMNEANEFISGSKLMYILATPQFIPLPHDQQVKLRTFANKTNISFLTEIEGTIKAQVPKSIGATVNTHTEQINNLNKELDRVKKLEESTVSTVTTESDFTTVEATSNGYFEDVKLEGKTLVNLVQNAKEYTLTRESVESGFAQVACDTYILDKNKDYTAIYIQISREGNTPKFSINNAETGNADYYNIALFDTSTTGYEVVIKKINRSYNWQTMRFYYDSEYIGTTKFKLLLLEGDHTQNPPSYFEGLKSVGQDVDEVNVLSCGKNLLNIEDATTTNDGVTFSYSNGVVTLSGTSTKDYITSPLISIANILQDGKCYRLSSIGTDAKVISTIRYMDGTNAQWADKVLWKSSYNKPFVYIQVQNSGTNCNGYKIQLQLEEVPNLDTQVTPYEPYVEDKKRLLYYNEETQTWEKPILREWDSIEKHANGKYYYHQRSGEGVFDGSEDEKWWDTSEYGSERENTLEFRGHANNILRNLEKNNLVCDKFNFVANIWNKDAEGIGCVENNSIDIRIPKSKLSTQDTAGFKQWLQANNVTVVYQLAQEKVYECTNIDLITYANETNYVVESGVLSPKTTLKVHSNMSNVVRLLQKKVSLLESNVTSYMITQNRLMLASRYNADTVSFKVDVATLRNSFEYDNDLYELILNNVLVGKDNYNREYIENLIRFYWMDFVISDEMYSTLFEIIEEQHNPKIEEGAPLI